MQGDQMLDLLLTVVGSLLEIDREVAVMEEEWSQVAPLMTWILPLLIAFLVPGISRIPPYILCIVPELTIGQDLDKILATPPQELIVDRDRRGPTTDPTLLSILNRKEGCRQRNERVKTIIVDNQADRSLTKSVAVVTMVAMGRIGGVGPHSSSGRICPDGLHVSQHVPLVVLGLGVSKVKTKGVEGRCDLPRGEPLDRELADEKDTLSSNNLVTDEGKLRPKVGEREILLRLEVLNAASLGLELI